MAYVKPAGDPLIRMDLGHIDHSSNSMAAPGRKLAEMALRLLTEDAVLSVIPLLGLAVPLAVSLVHENHW
jgi:hypothetical protein